jgi:predicted NAD/FAD-binding protein
VAILHTDRALLPIRSRAWASWNYNLGPGKSNGATVTYHMNRLQSLQASQEYCVTLNEEDSIDAAKVLKKIVYHHPIYTAEAVRAQSRWNEISGRNRTHFCGAYWFYGFHEDGLNSALRVARALSVEC